MEFDVMIVGGSYAGISAALPLARARRRVLVLDAGMRRNRFAQHAHGFLGQDGRPPGEIVADARSQLAGYPDVTWVEATARSAVSREHSFRVETTAGSSYDGSRLILAMGISDELPQVAGVQERWGKSIFHCPYCHGYELQQGRIGVLATGEMSLHQAMMLPDWGETTLFTNGVLPLTQEQEDQLRARRVTIETSPVVEVTGEHADVRLANGRVIRLDGLFTIPRARISTPLADQLGCALVDSPIGVFVKTDELQQTTVAGVFACGDIARPVGSIALAVAAGAIAGTAAHRSLIYG